MTQQSQTQSEALEHTEAFRVWSEKRGVWPRVFSDEAFSAGWQAALSTPAAAPVGLREALTKLCKARHVCGTKLPNILHDAFVDAQQALAATPPAQEVETPARTGEGEHVEVTQADRDIAADVLFHVDGDPFVDNIREGWEDESYLVQAFARHRIASLTATPADAKAQVKPRPYPHAVRGIGYQEFYGFEGGSMTIRTTGPRGDGSGWFCFGEHECDIEDEDGKIFYVVNTSKSELLFIRDKLNEIFPADAFRTVTVSASDTCHALYAHPTQPSGQAMQMAVDALRPFAACVEQISYDESDEEWAKFRLLIADYRRAHKAFIALSSDGGEKA